jgi:hypothetical protein
LINQDSTPHDDAYKRTWDKIFQLKLYSTQIGNRYSPAQYQNMR